MNDKRRGQIEGTAAALVLLWAVVWLVPAPFWILLWWSVGVVIVIGLIWWEF